MKENIMNLVKFSNQFPDVFERFFDNELFDWKNKNFSNTNTTLPSVNIRENADEFKVEVAAPGFNKEEFNIEVDGDVLVISSQKKSENEINEEERITKKEFSYQSFTRSFTLPALIRHDKIAAKYEDGILKIIIPKKDEAKPIPPKKIEIN